MGYLQELDFLIEKEKLKEMLALDEEHTVVLEDKHRTNQKAIALLRAHDQWAHSSDSSTGLRQVQQIDTGMTQLSIYAEKSSSSSRNYEQCAPDAISSDRPHHPDPNNQTWYCLGRESFIKVSLENAVKFIQIQQQNIMSEVETAQRNATKNARKLDELQQPTT